MTDVDVFEAMQDPIGPERVVVVSDRRTAMRGVLVIDNTARGMGKGGTRMSPRLTIEEVARLARTMTWKWAANDLYFGGAKAGIVADPSMPPAVREKVVRSFARALSNEIPENYVFGLDMGLTERDAAVVADELGSRLASVGMPRALGGLPYDELGVTGFGVAEALDTVAEREGRRRSATSVAIQGFGAVGRAAAQRLDELGYSILAISTASGTLFDADGLDIRRLAELSRELGDDVVSAMPELQVAPGAELVADVDAVLPCATQDVIGEAQVAGFRARILVEGANMPTTPAACAQLHGRGVTIVPDVIANAGGAIAAAHSMDQRSSARPVDEREVFADIAARIRRNTHTVLDEAARAGCQPHVAALSLARARVTEAMRLRGNVHV